MLVAENVAEAAGETPLKLFNVGAFTFTVVPLQLTGGKPVKLPFKHSDNEQPTLPASP
jgi:hypothetical protein